MNVLYLLPWTGGGGAGTQAKLLARYLKNEVDLKLLNAIEIDSDQLSVETETGIGVPMVYTNDIFRFVLEEEPDILFVHAFSQKIVQVIERLKKRRTKTKIVYRDGSNILEHFLVYPYDRRPDPIYVGFMFQFFDAVICPSKFVADQVSFLLPSDVNPKLAYIPPAVEIDSFIPTEYKGRRIIGSGRLETNNAYLQIINVYRRLLGKFGDLEFVLCGNGTYKPLYEEAAKTYGLKGFRVTGWLSQGQLFKELEKSDIFVMPSITQNGVPNSVLEAMAAGCIVVTSDCIAMREVQSTIKIPLEDLGSWYIVLEKLIEDKSHAKELIKNQLEEVKEFDIKKIIPVYKEVFEGLL